MAREVRFFRSAAAFRAWLERNHDRAGELVLGFYTVGSGKGGITYKQAVDEALCFGWIDGVRRRIDPTSYSNRFSPRRTGSVWSEVNIRRATELTEAGLMRPQGAAAFAARDEAKTARYSYERAAARLEPAFERAFRAKKPAWAFFEAQPPGYRRTATWWVMSAKRPETRRRRLETLIADSARGDRIGLLRRD